MQRNAFLQATPPGLRWILNDFEGQMPFKDVQKQSKHMRK